MNETTEAVRELIEGYDLDAQILSAVPAAPGLGWLGYIAAAAAVEGTALSVGSDIERALDLSDEDRSDIREGWRAYLASARLPGSSAYEIRGETVVQRGWWVDDGNFAVHYPAARSGSEAAERYVADGTWEIGEGNATTQWVSVHAWQDTLVLDYDCDARDEDDEGEGHLIAIEPDEPDCVDGRDHDWESPFELVGGIEDNPGVWGSGGGVLIKSACLRCGCGREEDTWAQDPGSGEQGLHSTSYLPDAYDVSEPLDPPRIVRMGGDEVGSGDVRRPWLVELHEHSDAVGDWWGVCVHEGDPGDHESSAEWFRDEGDARDSAELHAASHRDEDGVEGVDWLRAQILAYTATAWRVYGDVRVRYGCEDLDLDEWREQLPVLCAKHTGAEATLLRTSHAPARDTP